MSQEKSDINFLYEDKEITNAEYNSERRKIKNENNTIEYKKTSALEKRIVFSLQAEIQKLTFTVDRVQIELNATKIVDTRLKSLNLVKDDGKCLVNATMRDIAIAEESRIILREQVGNQFKFTKSELLKITKQTPNNISHLNKILKQLTGKDTHTIIETYVTSNFKEIRERRLNISMFPVTGEDVSLTNLKSEDLIIIEISKNFIPYLVSPNRNSYNKGVNLLLGKIYLSLKSEYSQILYKIIVDIENIWQNKIFTYKNLQKLFGTKYGMKKIINKKNGNFLKNKDNDFIYEIDNEKKLVYEDNYLLSWKYFKRDVLKKALEEVNSSKTPYLVVLDEIKESSRKPIEGIKFEISRKSKNIYNNLEKYKSISNYATLFYQFQKLENNEKLIQDIDAYSLALEEKLKKQKNYIKPINGAFNLMQLEELVVLNVLAIKELKKILLKDILELKHLKFNEKYLILTNTRSTRTTLLKIHRRYGNTAVEGLIYLKKNYSEVIKNHKNKVEKDFKNYLNFKFFDKTENKLINITKKNIFKYETKMWLSVKRNDKSNFKSFSSMYIKKQFYEIFFGDKV